LGKFAAIRWQTFWIWTAKWFEMVSLIIALTAQLYQSKRIRSPETGKGVDGKTPKEIALLKCSLGK